MQRKALFAGIFAFVLAADRLTKLWVASALMGSGARAVIPLLLELRYSENRGMALGLLSGNTMATLVLPIVAVGVWFFVFRRYIPTRYTAIASSAMLGGFAGNFLDRLLMGYVVDMIYFPFLPWFVCNVADIAICLGVAMMAFSLLLRPQDWREKHAKEDGESCT